MEEWVNVLLRLGTRALNKMSTISGGHRLQSGDTKEEKNAAIDSLPQQQKKVPATRLQKEWGRANSMC